MKCLIRIFTAIVALASANFYVFAASVEVSNPFQGVVRYHIQSNVPRLVDINLLMIDPAAAGISFFASPSNGSLPGETVTQTTRSFVTQYDLQIGVNGNFYSYNPSAPYTDLVGLAVSNGNAYSQFYANLPALNITSDNQLSIVTAIPGNQSFGPPFNSGYVPTPSVHLYNAVSGNEYIVMDGVNTATWADGLNPRSAAGITADGKLMLLTVDGRNPGHSLGMTTAEVADTMINYGAKYALNLDGGGSSTMVFADPTPRVMNVPVGVNNVPGSERSVGNNLGVRALSYATPQPTKYVFADFEFGDLGIFPAAPGVSASTQGINKGTSVNFGMIGNGHDSPWSQRLIIVDDPSTTSPAENQNGGWFVREIASSTLTSTQAALRATDGYVGFWAMTTTPGIETSLAIEGTTNSVVARGLRTSLFADGKWHLYQWNLDDDSQWQAWLTGNGSPDPRGFTLDSLLFFGPDANAVINIDDVSHNPAGSLAETPGDFNADGIVDAADYVAWRNNDVTQAGYDTWRANFGEPTGRGAGLSPVPEPSVGKLGLIACAGLMFALFGRTSRSRSCLLCGVAAVLLTGQTGVFAAQLPATSTRAPVPTPHFPDTLHSVVWRNWGLVPPSRLATVLGTTHDKITDLAVAMGLPRDVSVPAEMEQRGYITILRRNWHLLPYSQLLLKL